LAHPRFQVPRTYAVQVAGRPSPETIASLKEGMYFHEGRFHFKWIRRIGTKGNSAFLEVGLDHGQNREIRRLFARVGHKVMRLKRIAFGPLSLNKLSEGRFRPLTGAEMKSLRELSASPRRRRAQASQGAQPVASAESGVQRRSTPVSRSRRETVHVPRGSGRRRRKHE
jgi:23S rRNA pseudouridine2605 synthase